MKTFYLSLFLLTNFHGAFALAENIRWQPWSKAAFSQAMTEDKMIILDVGMEGCTACRWMDEITYKDDRVVNIINEHFVAIVADAEAQPDLGERYSDWAWPATIFMAADGTQILALAGNRRPASFIPILNKLIEKKAKGQLEADQLSPYSAAPEPVKTELSQIRDQLRMQLDSLLNDKQGGWSKSGISTATGARVEHLYLRAHMYSNAELLNLALLTTDGYLAAIDPVWGGVFVKTFHDNDNRPERFRRLGAVPEKRISNQANALIVFSHALRLSRDPKYLQGIEQVDAFLQASMMHKDGTFYTSQEDEPPALTATMSTIDYWLLDSDSKRRQFGVPPIDHAVYTDKNAEIITAYATAYEATGNDTYLNIAVRAAKILMASRLQADGWILQSKPSNLVDTDKRMRPLISENKPFLSAQVWFASALLSLYKVSGDEYWLAQALRIADSMYNSLYDKNTGGFFATPVDDTAAIILPRKPLEINAKAAQFFYDLWIYTKDERFAHIPEQTLRAVAVKDVLAREGKITGQTAIALEKITAAYVEFSVVGKPGAADTIALFEAGKNAYHPRKLLHYEKAGRYPEGNQAAMYICNPDRCSIPIKDPARVAKQADSFRLPASFSP